VHNFKATGVDEKFLSVGTSAAVELSVSSRGHYFRGRDHGTLEPVCLSVV
jgi:hypothetical protein